MRQRLHHDCNPAPFSSNDAEEVNINVSDVSVSSDRQHGGSSRRRTAQAALLCIKQSPNRNSTRLGDETQITLNP